MKGLIVLGMVGMLCLSGCAAQTNTQKGAGYGAAGGALAGALIGQAIGKNTKSTLVGAAIGAAVGGGSGAAVGHMMDKQEQQMREQLAASEAAAVEREGNLLSVIFKGDVTFDTNSARIRAGLYNELDRVASVVNQYPQTVIRVEGHTDSTGSESYNMDLSRRRAEAVRSHLGQRGVAGSRMEVVGYGESSPIASNASEAGRMRNRRVEIKIAPTANN